MPGQPAGARRHPLRRGDVPGPAAGMGRRRHRGDGAELRRGGLPPAPRPPLPAGAAGGQHGRGRRSRPRHWSWWSARWAGSGRRTDAPPAAAAERHGSALRLVNKRTEQANIILGGYACSYLDPRRSVLDLLNVVLGEGMSSRLFQELREERALAYDVHSFVAKLRDSGCLGIYLGCEPRRAAEAVRVAVEELARLATTAVERRTSWRGRRSTPRAGSSSTWRGPAR